MVRRVRTIAAAVAVVAVTTLAAAPPVSAAPSARASITFDVGTGVVLSSHNAHARERVASTAKLLTALVVRANVPMDDEVPITARAAEVPPLKMTMEPGSHWRANDLLHSMLIASLNDTATALAIRAGGGSLAGFEKAAAAETRRLGLVDQPRMVDPAGLDGSESVDGGNLISAHDMAIVTRAFLADPLLAGIVRLPSYEFNGGDGRPHVVYNHNAFLSIYPGAIGVKTGYTEKSGHSLVAAATRDGRTIATVVIGSPDPVGDATRAIDAGFAIPTESENGSSKTTLPARGIAPTVLDDPTPRSRPASFTARVPPGASSGFGSGFLVVVIALVLAAATTIGVRVRRRRTP